MTGLRQVLGSRLCWRLTAGLFIGMVAVQALVALDEMGVRKRRALDRVETEASAIVAVLDRLAPANIAPGDFGALMEQIMGGTNLKGGAVYDSAGRVVHAFGEMPAIVPGSRSSRDGERPEMFRRRTGDRYDLAWRMADKDQTYYVAVRTGLQLVPVHGGSDAYGILLRTLAAAILATLVGAAVVVPLVVAPVLKIREALARNDAGFIDGDVLGRGNEIEEAGRSIQRLLEAAEENASRSVSAD